MHDTTSPGRTDGLTLLHQKKSHVKFNDARYKHMLEETIICPEGRSVACYKAMEKPHRWRLQRNQLKRKGKIGKEQSPLCDRLGILAVGVLHHTTSS